MTLEDIRAALPGLRVASRPPGDGHPSSFYHDALRTRCELLGELTAIVEKLLAIADAARNVYSSDCPGEEEAALFDTLDKALAAMNDP